MTERLRALALSQGERALSTTGSGGRRADTPMQLTKLNLSRPVQPTPQPLQGRRTS